MLRIRFEWPHDAAPICALHSACFPTTAEAELVDRLRDAAHLCVSIVAEEDGVVIGHVAFSPVRSATGEFGAGLAPLAVSEGCRRRGIAAKLVQVGLESCRQRGIGWVVVLGDPAYYSRFGFLPANEFGLSDAYGGGGAFQAMELIPVGLPRNGGLVRYGPEFDVFNG